MPPSSVRAPVEAIRRAAQLAVEATSLRAVARDVDMSPMGLRAFLEGRTPYSATLRKLNAWYIRHAANRPCYSADEARAGLAVLLEGIPEGEREDAAARLLAFLLEEHRQRRSQPPGWLKELHPPG